MGGAPCCKKVGLNKGLWSAEEDDILRKYIEANGEGSWKSIPQNAGLKRCGKSCRLRWVNYLRGDLVRGNITSEEEDIIIKMYNKIGSRWSVIAGHLPAGRTDNEIKNYWNTYLSRRIYTIKRPMGESSSSPTSLMVDIVKMDGCCKRKGRTMKRVARKKNNFHHEILSNAENKDGSNDLENENAGLTLNSSSDEEIETTSWSSPIMELDNENLGPYHDLDQSCMLVDDNIMSENLSSVIDILSVNEKDNEVITLSDGQIGLLVGSNGAAAPAAESTGGVSLSSNGAATAAETAGGVSLSSNGAAAESTK